MHSTSSLNTVKEHQDMVSNFENEQKFREIERQMPKDETSVKSALRDFGYAETLEGEDAAARRDRLKGILASGKTVQSLDKMDIEEEDAEEFFTEGPKSLKDVRLSITKYSHDKTLARIAMQKKLSLETASSTFYDKINIENKDKLFQKMSLMTNCGSQVGDSRPLNSIVLGDEILTGSWSGLVKSWDRQSLKLKKTYEGHDGMMITDIVLNHVDSNIYFATGSNDSTAKLWTRNEAKSTLTLSGHTDRLGRLSFHPSGRFLFTSSFDKTWRMWDLNTQTCLYEQEGHSTGVFCVAAHPNGSLLTSCDMGGIARIWDLRTGKTVITFTGHAKQIVSTDWSPNGFDMITGSDDKSIRVWDLRAQKCVSNIPAHLKLISRVKYETSGRFFVSSSFDKSIKIWSSVEHKLIKTLGGHEDKVTYCDISNDNEMIVSCSWDKTWKVWKGGEEDLDLDF